jgi:hypothetical protein
MTTLSALAHLPRPMGRRVYDRPIGPPTLGQHLSALAVKYANGPFNSLHQLDPDVIALRFALRVALCAQLDTIRGHIVDMTAIDPRDGGAVADRWDHNYGDGYRQWAASMDAALSMLDEIPLEPNFND